MPIAAAAFVGPWEGERLEACLDRIASPPVWTVCYGETKGIKSGDKYIAQQCLDMLGQSLAGHHARLSKCIPALPQQPQGVQVALTSWTCNVGAGAACGSPTPATGAAPATSCRGGTRPAAWWCEA